MTRRILVRVTTAGEVSVEARGFQGRGCEAATRAIEEALGKPAQRTRKPEFWQQAQHHCQTVGEGGGAP